MKFSCADFTFPLLAHDKALPRFVPRPPGAEAPRDVFAAAAANVAQPMIADGWTFARSGPHLSRRTNNVTAKLKFGSNPHNLAEHLVGFRATVECSDHSLRAWRQSINAPLRTDGLVSSSPVGNLVDPPRWIEWNLVDPDHRDSIVVEIVELLRDVVRQRVDPLVAALAQPQPDLGVVQPAIHDSALVEYLVRADKFDEAARIIDARTRRATHDKERFVRLVTRFRESGLPTTQLPPDSPAAFAYLVARFELPATMG